MSPHLMTRFTIAACVALVACRSAATQNDARHALLTIKGQAVKDYFGFSVDGIGDVDSDGHPDLIAGAYGVDGPAGADAGRAYIVSGRDGGVLKTLDGQAASDWFGFCVRGLGDLDSDGVPDIAVGAPQDDRGGTNAGSVTVYSGRSWQSIYTVLGAKAHDGLGGSLAKVADADSDGVPDLIVGVIGDDTKAAEAGSATLYSGKTGKPLYTVYGDNAYDQLGVSVAGVGDVDADGAGDFVAGAWKNDAKGRDAGAARVFSGRSGKVLFTFYGEKLDDFFGNAVAGAGDVDNDGTPDVVVGAMAASRPLKDMGTARVFSGKTGAQIWSWVGDNWGFFLGVSVGAAGDVDRDGHDDVCVGVWGDNTNGAEAGSARVYSGRTGALLHRADGAPGDALGVSVAPGGDLNQDDWPDVVFGALQSATTKRDTGYVIARSVHEQFLRADTCCVSITTGGSQRMSLAAGSEHANRLYLIVGSASGTSPGIRVGSLTISVNSDAYHLLLLGSPNTLVLGSVGFLDAAGAAQARFTIVGGLDPKLRGLVLHHCAIAISTAPALVFASNAVPVRLR